MDRELPPPRDERAKPPESTRANVAEACHDLREGSRPELVPLPHHNDDEAP